MNAALLSIEVFFQKHKKSYRLIYISDVYI